MDFTVPADYRWKYKKKKKKIHKYVDRTREVTPPPKKKPAKPVEHAVTMIPIIDMCIWNGAQKIGIQVWNTMKDYKKKNINNNNNNNNNINQMIMNMKVTVIPILIGAFGTDTKGLLQGQEDLEIREWVETIKITALLRSARILRRVLATWGD